VIAQMIVGVVLLGAAVSGWVMAYRARGQANTVSDRARLAEAKADAAVRKQELAQSNEAAMLGELKALKVELSGAKQTINRLQKERQNDLEKLAAAGVPVGDVLVDSALGDLYPHEGGDRREAGAGDGGQDGGGGPVPDDVRDPAGGTDPRG
jgi:hypothetical protein